MPENKNQTQGRDLKTDDIHETDYKGTGGTGQVANQWDKETGGGQSQQKGTQTVNTQQQDNERTKQGATQGNTQGGGSQKSDTAQKDVKYNPERDKENEKQRDKDTTKRPEELEEEEEVL
jgi:hypothetical protein